MSIETWLAFAAASCIMLAIPGPTILLVISYALGHGRKTALATVTGVTLGDFTAMTASLAGLGALLATSATLFTILKLIGAAYLMFLGIKLWRAPDRDRPDRRQRQSSRGKTTEDSVARLCCDGTKPEEHRLLHRLRAAISRHVEAFPSADPYFGGDFPDFGSVELIAVRFHRRHGPWFYPQGKRATRRQPDRRNPVDCGRRSDRRIPPDGCLRPVQGCGVITDRLMGDS